MRLKHLLSVFLTLLTLGVGQMWGAEGTTHDCTSGNTRSVVLNNQASISPISITSLTYPVKKVAVTCSYNKSTDGVTVSCTIGGNAFGTSQTINSSTTTTFNFEGSSTSGDVIISFVNNTNASKGMGTFQVTSVVLTEGAAAGPSYTVTAQSNNTTYGTVSLTGTTITGAPKTNCRYASPAYSVSPANSATVSQNGNAFTVTPSANTTVTINFEPIPTHTVTWSANGTTTSETYQEGADIEFPESATGCTGGTFKGWTTSPIVGTLDVAPTYVTSATMGENDITYYAVFADEDSEESSKTYELVIDYSDFVNSGGYGANDGDHSSTATATDDSGATIDIDWISSNVMRGASPNNTKMQFRNSPGYIYNTTSLGQ